MGGSGPFSVDRLIGKRGDTMAQERSEEQNLNAGFHRLGAGSAFSTRPDTIADEQNRRKANQ
jgi:hypothetical protein